jgi:hypothetical protein
VTGPMYFSTLQPSVGICFRCWRIRLFQPGIALSTACTHFVLPSTIDRALEPFVKVDNFGLHCEQLADHEGERASILWLIHLAAGVVRSTDLSASGHNAASLDSVAASMEELILQRARFLLGSHHRIADITCPFSGPVALSRPSFLQPALSDSQALAPPLQLQATRRWNDEFQAALRMPVTSDEERCRQVGSLCCERRC